MNSIDMDNPPQKSLVALNSVVKTKEEFFWVMI